MHGFEDIPLATTVRSGNSGRGPRRNPNGIDVLLERRSQGTIPGFSISPQTMAEATGQEHAFWQRMTRSDDCSIARSLSELGEMLFPGEDMSGWETLPGYTDDLFNSPGFHTDEVDAEISLLVHCKAKMDNPRPIYIAMPTKKQVKVDIPRSLDADEVAEKLKESFPAEKIWAGNTVEGMGTVLSNCANERTPHLVRESGAFLFFPFTKY